MKTLAFVLLALSLSAIAHDSTKEYLSAEEVRQSIVGHTFYGTFVQDGKELAYSSFSLPDGQVFYLDETGYKEGGALIVRDDGCVFVNWDAGDEFDGCYYYTDNGDGTVTEQTPVNGEATVKVVPGDPENLSG